MKILFVYYPNLLELLGKGWTESELCRIHNIHSRRYEVQLPDSIDISTYTIKRLKEVLEDLHGLEASEQTVRLRGRVLEDGECLASCAVMNGTTLLLGLSKPMVSEKTNDDPDKMSCRTAMARQSETMTVAHDCPEGDQSTPPHSAEPWWTSSRLSGPRGGGSSSGTWSQEPSGSLSPAGAAAAQVPATSTFPSPYPAAACASAGGVSPEEMRRRRLARFG
eukprot:TRINITY_DN23757_c0_g1_i2.p1 TRINITY_DN23757_c0_g1~~TRINITY_DN23757_c0_g1_i2.p1  ORF type:complete len:240 (+),score=28.63 TRINITY_DN23757_c0_g1_i2:58-720(+)